MLVFNNKKKLSGTSIAVKEDLTWRRVQVLKEACEKFGKKNFWSANGKILIRINNEVHKVTDALGLVNLVNDIGIIQVVEQ